MRGNVWVIEHSSRKGQLDSLFFGAGHKGCGTIRFHVYLGFGISQCGAVA
jgi:hypothetical protein